MTKPVEIFNAAEHKPLPAEGFISERVMLFTKDQPDFALFGCYNYKLSLWYVEGQLPVTPDMIDRFVELSNF